jgi:hypothetical protein
MLRLRLRGVGSVVDVEERKSRIQSGNDSRLLGGQDEPKCQSDRSQNQTAAGAHTHEEFPRNSLNQ